MPDSLGAGDAKPDSDRPSFTGYWKRSKDEQAAQNLTFVSSKLGQQPSSAQGKNEGQTEEPFAGAKAKARRQQVRNAQRQHRLRKANYTKQLEMDITKLRDDIAKVEQQLESLRTQNGAIRCQLTGREPQQQQQQQPPPAAVTPAVDMPPVNLMSSTTDMAFSTTLAPQYIVSLDMAESLGTPAFHVSRSPPSLHGSSSSSSGGGKATATETLGSATPVSTVDTSLDDVAVMEATLSEEQIDQAINFILALEHCCWNHVDKSCFEHNHNHHHHHHHHQQQGAHAADSPSERAVNGHALMATTLALQGAPPAVFTRMNDLQQKMNPFSSTSATNTTNNPTTSSSSPQTTTVTAAVGGSDRGQLAWPSRALTLTNLRRLAGTLNASAAAELAPVQAWFELVSLYGVGIATDGAVLERLKFELAGEVHCVMFGAAVDRDVFEAVLKRVIGFLPRTWSPPPRPQIQAGEGQEGMMMGYEEVDEEGVEEMLEDMAGMDMEEMMEDMSGMGMGVEEMLEDMRGMGMEVGVDEINMNVGNQVPDPKGDDCFR
ncbi:hypothetical protein GGR55DRAFT_694479 [Xylaria sp. FL0064]|nr:hypothetical protein GGR55DRAFT_694479 [Xylaria sp. FL0064]